MAQIIITFSDLNGKENGGTIDLFHNHFSSSGEQPNNVYEFISQNNQLPAVSQYFANKGAI